MTAAMLTSVLSNLESRRQGLGMTVEALAKRSKVSRATVRRILSGDYTAASLWNVMALAHALGMSTRFDPVADDCAFMEQQAEKKARYLVGMVQGNMGLEAQALPSSEIDKMIWETKHKLLSGSKRKLWR